MDKHTYTCVCVDLFTLNCVNICRDAVRRIPPILLHREFKPLWGETREFDRLNWRLEKTQYSDRVSLNPTKYLAISGEIERTNL